MLENRTIKLVTKGVMHLLESEWLIRMLQKAGNTPQTRMLSLFSILDDWTEAPHISNSSPLKQASDAPALIQFLTQEATKANAQNPEMLANQLFFMAIAAYNAKPLHADSFIHAHHAAKVMISSQTRISKAYSKKMGLGLVANVVLVIVLTSLITLYPIKTAHHQQLTINLKQDENRIQNVSDIKLSSTASPKKTAALYAQLEQMRKGDCQLVEALQLPDAYKAIYFENIVMGHISSDLNEQRIVNEILDKVRCNYKPMLMANSTS